MADGGFEFVINLLGEPWRAFWMQVVLIEELDEKIVFGASESIVPYLVQSAPMLREAMKDCHCSTPARYRIEIRAPSGTTVCI